MSTVVDFLDTPGSRPFHSSAACTRLLSRFLVGLAELRPLVVDDKEAGTLEGAVTDRAVVERLTSALWGVFSHHRAVIDAAGRHYDLGSWRSAAEFLTEAANYRYPDIGPPIRYMDCYMGVLLGEERRPSALPLHRWIFTRLHDAGCDWIYSFSPELSSEERRVRLRELSVALAQAYENAGGAHAPLPSVVAAYRDVYGRLPEGWPA